jgi:hypothetical protein
VFSPIPNYDASRTNQNMLLTIRTTHHPATDLGFLLHKHPDHVHTRESPFGNATVFYPEATDDACSRRHGVFRDHERRKDDASSGVLSDCGTRRLRDALPNR